MIQILKGEEVIREMEDSNEQDLLKRAKIDAELMSRDQEGEFSARIKPEGLPKEPA